MQDSRRAGHKPCRGRCSRMPVPPGRTGSVRVLTQRWPTRMAPCTVSALAAPASRRLDVRGAVLGADGLLMGAGEAGARGGECSQKPRAAGWACVRMSTPACPCTTAHVQLVGEPQAGCRSSSGRTPTADVPFGQSSGACECNTADVCPLRLPLSLGSRSPVERSPLTPDASFHPNNPSLLCTPPSPTCAPPLVR